MVSMLQVFSSKNQQSKSEEGKITSVMELTWRPASDQALGELEGPSGPHWPRLNIGQRIHRLTDG